MDITREELGGLAVLILRGRLVVSADESEIRPFRSAIDALIADGRLAVTLDLSGLQSIDARGLGELAFTLFRLRKRGGELTMIAPTPAVRQLLHVTRLDTAFPIRSDERTPHRAHRRPEGDSGNDDSGIDGLDLREAPWAVHPV